MKNTEKPILTSFDDMLDEEYGVEGTPSRDRFEQQAWQEYTSEVLLDTRKSAGLTQEQVAQRIGASKGYISRIERGLTVPTATTLYKIVAAMGHCVEIKPVST